MAYTDIAEDVRSRLDAEVAGWVLRNLHSVVLALDERIVLERYYRGLDERWGQPLGSVEFTSWTLHDLRSVTKSIVGLLYGIASAEDKVPPPEEPLLRHLTRYSDLAGSPEHLALTVADALTMQLGLRWDEDFPYADPRNSETAMESSRDRCRFVLEQPMVDEPGTRWRYTGGATALLASLIMEGAGTTLLEYARSRLFEPLDIREVEWVTGCDAVEIAASGLRMRPADVAKIGLLVLNHGMYKGRRLIPEHWLKASLEPRARVDDDLWYGYHWWVAPKWSWVAAIGNGGQRLTVSTSMDLVLVVTAGNYNAPDAWKVPAGVFAEAVLPALNR